MLVLALCGTAVSLMQTLVVPLLPDFPRLLDTSADNAAWLVTVTLLTSAVAALNRFEGVAYFAFFALLQLGAAVVFALVAWWYPAPPARAAES